MFMRYLLLICAKAPFSIVIFSVWFSFYGGLLHFVYYYFTETKCSTALSACIFLPLLLCSGGVFPLPLQKTRLFYSSVKKDTTSIAVRGLVLYMYASLPYRRNWLWRDYFSLITSHIIAYKRLCFISIFLLLFL